VFVLLWAGGWKVCDCSCGRFVEVSSKTVEILDGGAYRCSASSHDLAKRQLQGIVYSEGVKEARDRPDSFARWRKEGGYQGAAERLEWDY